LLLAQTQSKKDVVVFNCISQRRITVDKYNWLSCVVIFIEISMFPEFSFAIE